MFRTPLVYLFIFVLYSIGLWRMSIPLTGDQKVYLSIALEMREKGEWIIPYLFGEPNFLKPPLQYWATLAGWKAFGFGMFGALIPSVLAMIACAFYVKKLSPKTESRWLAPLLFAGTIGTMTYGTTGQMEIWIVLFYLAAWDFWLAQRFFLTFLAVGVMAWVKGPLYPVLWVMSSWIWLLLERRFFATLKQARYWLSLIIGILVGLSWYLLAARTHFEQIKNVFFLQENMGKLSTPQGSPLKLWAEFFYSLLPVGLLLFKRSGGKLLPAQRNFHIAYWLLPAVFFTVFPYHVGTYLYLLTPVAVWWMVQKIEDFKSNRVVNYLSALIAFALGILTLRLLQGNWIQLELALPLILSLVVWSAGFFKNNARFIAVASLLIVNLIRMGAIELGAKDLAGLRLDRETHQDELAYWIQEKDVWHEFGYVSAAIQQDIKRIEEKDVLPFLKNKGALILQDGQMLSYEVALTAQCTDWPRLKRRVKFPLRDLLLHGRSATDPELYRHFQICRL